MAKWEIHKRAGNLFDAIWWKFMPTDTITVKWPNGPVIKEHIDQYKTDAQLLSSDPNDHYRPLLEQLVGRQRWDWNWRFEDNNITDNRLTIKIRKCHGIYATYFAIRWN
jgi:hypothetical protein